MQKTNLFNTLKEVWVVEFRESERGWGSDTWTTWHETLEEAQEVVRKTNTKNTSKEVPDYYICAYEPKRFTEYYRIK